MFHREDWTLFRNLQTLGQKAGVGLERLPDLGLKELVDNALDVGATVTLKDCGDGRFEITDNGPGIPGTDAEIASLFSIRRPMTSSKLLRLPTRGALGNGLRVVAGIVLASRGQLAVSTGGRADRRDRPAGRRRTVHSGSGDRALQPDRHADARDLRVDLEARMTAARYAPTSTLPTLVVMGSGGTT